MSNTLSIEEGNELIVDFLGGKYAGTERMDGHDYDMFDLPASFPIKLSEPDMFGMKRTGYLGFHMQWDWLMEVVEKINNLPMIKGAVLQQTAQKESVIEGLMNVNMRSVWKSCIQFIQWYNTTKSKP